MTVPFMIVLFMIVPFTTVPSMLMLFMAGNGDFRNLTVRRVSIETVYPTGTNWWGSGEPIWVTNIPSKANEGSAGELCCLAAGWSADAPSLYTTPNSRTKRGTPTQMA